MRRFKTPYVTRYHLGSFWMQVRKIDGHHVGAWRQAGWFYVDVWRWRLELAPRWSK